MSSTVPDIPGAGGWFPGAAESTYLDAAGISLVSRPAADAVSAFLAEAEADPSGAHHGPRLERARAAVARLVKAQPHQIALMPSTSAGLNTIADSIVLRPGDNVVISELEFISIVAPFQHRCRAAGASLRIAATERGRLDVDRILEAIDARTRAVVVSSVVWTTGFRVDVAEIGRECRRLGVSLVVDGIQQLGAIGLDVDESCIDVLVCGGHKWLGSPSGMGFIFATDAFTARHGPTLPYAPTALAPGEDWLSLWSDPEFSPVREFPHAGGARRFEIGCHHAAMSACGLEAAINVLEAAGTDAVAEHVIKLGNRVAEGLSELGLEVVSSLDDAHRSGITTFHAGSSAADDVELAGYLRERRIITAVRYTSGAGGLRVSCHLYNTTDDVDRLLEAVRAKPAPR